jgi:hypothetical protein
MESDTVNATEAGYYQLISFKIRPFKSKPGEGVELNQIVTSWQLSEGIDSPNIMGSCVILDSEGLLRKLPILGEEYITIKYKDFFGKSSEKEFYCFSVRDVKPYDDSKDNLLQYALDFTSIENFNANQQEVAKSYSNMLVSDMAKNVYEEFFLTQENNANAKPIEIEPTVGNQTFCIPTLSPARAMDFLARRAYGGEDSMNNYKFFETRDSFYFCTPNYMAEKYMDMTTSPEVIIENNLLFNTNKVYDNNTPEGQLSAQQTLQSINYGNPTNTIEEIGSGQYKRSVFEIDILNRTTSRTSFDYREYADRNNLGDIKINHSEDFISNNMPSIQETFVIKDYNTPGQVERADRFYPFYAEVINSRRVFNSHLAKYEINCGINGRIALVPGMVIFIMVDRIEVANNPQADRERDGFYMITGITNVHEEDTYVQLLSMTKGGLSQSYDRALFSQQDSEGGE